LEDSQMSTLLYMVFDPEEGTLHWVNAGHPPPLVVTDGCTSFLEGGRGVPLGVMAFPTFEDARDRLESGSIVLLYTDGLVERPGSHLDVGMERLAAEVSGVEADPEAICDHLLATVVDEGPGTDDVALLALHNTPMSEHLDAELPAEPESLASSRALLRRWLHHGGIEAREIGEIISAAGEACANAIEHGARHGSDRFRLSGELSDGELTLTVQDDGSWRPARQGDQGRGLSLMDALMDSVELSHENGGTTVQMRRRVRSGVGA
jgi:anti-sigma regulatory factor (Ser/Thr protein kinase)